MKIVETGKETTSENPKTIKITDKENLAVIRFHGCHTLINLSMHITHNSKFEKITVAWLIISIKRHRVSSWIFFSSYTILYGITNRQTTLSTIAKASMFCCESVRLFEIYTDSISTFPNVPMTAYKTVKVKNITKSAFCQISLFGLSLTTTMCIQCYLHGDVSVFAMKDERNPIYYRINYRCARC